MRIERGHIEYLDLIADLVDQYRVFYQKPSNLPEARDFIFDRLTRNDSILYIAFDEINGKEKAVGFVQLYPSFSTVSLRSIWILNDLFVIPEARKRGVGTQLMQAAKGWAEEFGSLKLILETAKDNNTAQSLYKTHGYVKDDVFDRYALYLESPVTAVR